LRNAELAAGAPGTVWLDYARDANGQWQANASRSVPEQLPPGARGKGHRHHPKHPHPHE